MEVDWPERKVFSGGKSIFSGAISCPSRDCTTISNHGFPWVSAKRSSPAPRFLILIVKGIGEKGAAVIANNFATVAEALAAAHEAHDSLPPALAKKIIAGADYLSIAPKLVRVARDAPLPKVNLSIPKAPADLSKLYQIKDQYGLGASIDRLIAALGW